MYYLLSGCKYPSLPPPPLPLNYVCRQELLDDITSKLCNAPISSSKTIAVTGVGGFGKTTTVTALCHHPLIQEKFTYGVLFVELGPQATDPIIKLNELYFELAGKSNKNFNNVEAEIKKLTKNNMQNLLVIIDDVWDLEDARKIVQAFSNCHVVFTTRKNNIAQTLTAAENVVMIDSMKLDEATALLTKNLFDLKKLSNEELKLLEKVAQDAHMWPVLLSLIRGQLYHSLKLNICSQEAIKKVQERLQSKGLTAFDKNDVDSVNRPRNKSVSICMDTTLELLDENVLNKYFTLILFTGIGGHFIKGVLYRLWNVSTEEAKKAVKTLSEYGLILSKKVTVLFYSKYQVICTHSVLSQYTIEHIRSDQVASLSPFAMLNTDKSVRDELEVLFKKSYEIQNMSQSDHTKDYLIYSMHNLEQVVIPFQLKRITAHLLHDPHVILLMLQRIQTIIHASSNEIQILTQFSEEIVKIDSECKKVFKKSWAIDRTINSKVQHFLFAENYTELESILENKCTPTSIGLIARDCIKMIDKIIPLCEDSLKTNFGYVKQMLETMTPQLHTIDNEKMPIMKLYIKLHRDIVSALKTGLPEELSKVYAYIFSGSFNKELKSVSLNYQIDLQKNIPEVLSSSLAMYKK